MVVYKLFDDSLCKVSLYNHFSFKEELVEAIYQFFMGKG